MNETFYSNGKLLLTGEYVVLDGAKALALPTKFGQSLTVSEGLEKSIKWTSYDKDGSIWFEDLITFSEISNKETERISTLKSTLIEILHAAFMSNPDYLNKDGYTITTNLTFPKFWGLGTSSTLINNIAQWLKLDAFQLLQDSFGGSGYDIAAAQHDSPIIYELENGLPKVSPVNFNPAFIDNLFFVYLNRKQSSKAAINSYYINRVSDLNDHITEINRITNAVTSTDNPGIFARELQNHESIISDILKMKTVGETFFKDFPGVVKSLGGWGGDFVLAMSHENPTDYFSSLGFNTVIPYRDIIL